MKFVVNFLLILCGIIILKTFMQYNFYSYILGILIGGVLAMW